MAPLTLPVPDREDFGVRTDGERIVRLETEVKGLSVTITRFDESLTSYVLQLAKRPSWGVVLALAIMQAIIGVLATALAYSAAVR